jgi:hypothetical protein
LPFYRRLPCVCPLPASSKSPCPHPTDSVPIGLLDSAPASLLDYSHVSLLGGVRRPLLPRRRSRALLRGGGRDSLRLVGDCGPTFVLVAMAPSLHPVAATLLRPPRRRPLPPPPCRRSRLPPSSRWSRLPPCASGRCPLLRNSSRGSSLLSTFAVPPAAFPVRGLPFSVSSSPMLGLTLSTHLLQGALAWPSFSVPHSCAVTGGGASGCSPPPLRWCLHLCSVAVTLESRCKSHHFGSHHASGGRLCGAGL